MPVVRRVLLFGLTGFATGLAGTAVMTLTTWCEKRLRSTTNVPVDYDATQHVVTAAARVIHHQPTSHAQSRALFALTHWGYGSAVAISHHALTRNHNRVLSAVLFYAGCQSMAFSLFPTLGDTPPPWRWRQDVLASSLAQHAIYAIAVSATDRWISAAAFTVPGAVTPHVD